MRECKIFSATFFLTRLHVKTTDKIFSGWIFHKDFFTAPFTKKLFDISSHILLTYSQKHTTMVLCFKFH